MIVDHVLVQVISASRSERIVPFTGLQPGQFQKLVRLVTPRGGEEIADGRPGRQWRLDLADRVLLVATYWRTNLTMRQIGPLFGVSHSAAHRVIQRALPSAGETKIKLDAAQRMVARAEQRLAVVTASQQARLDEHARRTRRGPGGGRRAANGRPPVPLEAKVLVARQRARLATAQEHLDRARHPRPTPSPAARASLTDPDSRRPR